MFRARVETAIYTAPPTSSMRWRTETPDAEAGRARCQRVRHHPETSSSRIEDGDLARVSPEWRSTLTRHCFKRGGLLPGAAGSQWIEEASSVAIPPQRCRTEDHALTTAS
jgi:hypothetical protein